MIVIIWRLKRAIVLIEKVPRVVPINREFRGIIAWLVISCRADFREIRNRRMVGPMFRKEAFPIRIITTSMFVSEWWRIVGLLKRNALGWVVHFGSRKILMHFWSNTPNLVFSNLTFSRKRVLLTFALDMVYRICFRKMNTQI